MEMFDAGPRLGLERWEPHARVALRVTRTVRKRVPGYWWRWETTVEISWYVTNRVGRRVTYYAKAIRGHWGIENCCRRRRPADRRRDIVSDATIRSLTGAVHGRYGPVTPAIGRHGAVATGGRGAAVRATAAGLGLGPRPAATRDA